MLIFFKTSFFVSCISKIVHLIFINLTHRLLPNNRFTATQQIAARSPPLLNLGANRGVSHMAIEAEVAACLFFVLPATTRTDKFLRHLLSLSIAHIQIHSIINTH